MFAVMIGVDLDKKIWVVMVLMDVFVNFVVVIVVVCNRFVSIVVIDQNIVVVVVAEHLLNNHSVNSYSFAAVDNRLAVVIDRRLVERLAVDLFVEVKFGRKDIAGTAVSNQTCFVLMVGNLLAVKLSVDCSLLVVKLLDCILLAV